MTWKRAVAETLAKAALDLTLDVAKRGLGTAAERYVTRVVSDGAEPTPDPAEASCTPDTDPASSPGATA